MTIPFVRSCGLLSFSLLLGTTIAGPGPARAELGFASCIVQGQFAAGTAPEYHGQRPPSTPVFTVERTYGPEKAHETVVRLCKTSPGGKAYFAISFNATRRIPDWVAYRLEPGMGRSYREGEVDYRRDGADFSPDPELRLAHVPQAIPFTYARDAGVPGTLTPSGRSERSYQKGHLVPSQDMAFDIDANLSTFHYSNCAPQTPALNMGLWRTLEGRIRDWAAGRRPLDGEKRERTLWIVTGVFGRADRSERGPAIGPYPRWRATVPSHFFKIITYETNGGSKVRAWLFPNFIKRPDHSELEHFEVDPGFLERKSDLRFGLATP